MTGPVNATNNTISHFIGFSIVEAQRSYIAEADIAQARILKRGTNSTDRQNIYVVQATDATDPFYGISYIPTTSGCTFTAYTMGSIYVTAGAAIAADALITSDSMGRAITSTTNGDYVLGFAQGTTTAAGQLVLVRISIFKNVV